MTAFQIILVSLIALIHVYILILEMFFWTSEKGMKAFGLKSKDFAEDTKVLAANQGLYNGFLAAGLFWSLYTNDTNLALFFVLCVFTAGIYGAYSTQKIKILFIQSLPALLALFALWIHR